MSEPVTVFLVGPREDGKRLDRFLNEKIPGLSRSRIQRAIRERVRLSWKAAARASTPVRAGGEVRIGYTPVHEELLEIPLPVIARGTGWLAVDKPAGIPVHPVNRVRENSLIRMLRRQEGVESLRLVHRLDRETSGVLLVADNAETASRLSRAFMRGSVHKDYLAVVRGVVGEDSGTIDLPIGPATSSRVFVRREAGAGQPARTDWSVIERAGDRTVLRVHPATGRRHQIRVHLAAIGHPVLGDPLYGRPDEDYLDLVRGVRDARKDEGAPPRQLLHCARLVFPDPTAVDSSVVEVNAAPPVEFFTSSGVNAGSSPPPRAGRA